MTPNPIDRYVYSANLVRVIDGDTVVLNIDLGFDNWRLKEHCRLLGIDAPEKRGASREAGLASKAHLEQLLADTQQLLITTEYDRTGSFGRVLATLWADGENLNRRMVEDGFADTRE